MKTFILFEESHALTQKTDRERFALQPGDVIRSYSFPGVQRANHFLEGTITDLTPLVDQDQLFITFRVTNDQETVADHSKVGQLVHTYFPQELDRLWEYERIQIIHRHQS